MKTRAKKGEWKGVCDDCKESFYASMLYDIGGGLKVCKVNGCYGVWEINHPQDFYRATPDDQSVPWTRPEATESFEDTSGWVDTSTDDPDDTPTNHGDL